MNASTSILCAVAAALLTGCPPAREPLPSGLPPEYETPRSYDPDTNIDGAAAETDELPDEPPPTSAAPPPAPPTSAAPPPAPPSNPATPTAPTDPLTPAQPGPAAPAGG